MLFLFSVQKKIGKSATFKQKKNIFQVYYHGDPIQVRVKINNQTNKVVKKITIASKMGLAEILLAK